jgi:Spy/CpxP family protein refolding chaperone
MLKMRMFAGMLAVAVLTGGWLLAQDKKDGDTPAAKAKGQLPQNWKKIGLTDDQVQKIYKIQGEYRPKIDEAKAKAAALGKEMNEQMVKVLTDEQKVALKKLAETKAGVGGDTKKPDDKKPAEKDKK